ncbi:REP-associated tyrosine transposase [Runella sp. SP2]|uniref:REP-associated tyrosine transposase n=1 Tax=Runella sp. SP2 TaxID=2268026 RepID=UPI0013DE285B|nr:transposase [Runella sp. SP2]
MTFSAKQVLQRIKTCFMGTKRISGSEDERCFFITTSCYQHKFLLLDTQAFNIVLDNFRFYNKRYSARLLGYVLMSNHIHFMLFFEDRNYLSKYLRDFKKYSSLQLRAHISRFYPHILPEILYEYRSQHYKIWDDEFDDVVIYSRKMCEIKLDYMHNNPVKAGLVTEPSGYLFSSAKFYENWKVNIQSELLHYRDVF